MFLITQVNYLNKSETEVELEIRFIASPIKFDIVKISILKAFFKLLNNYYEYIILDTPPVQPVSDTLLLSQASDYNILIARSQYTKMLGIRSTIKKLNNLNIKADGIILNSMDTSRSSYYGYYYYYGGYYTKGYKYA